MSHPAINIATEAAYAAGEMMRRSLKNLDSVPVAKKARHDYVCEVDRACEAAIVKEIMRFQFNFRYPKFHSWTPTSLFRTNSHLYILFKFNFE